MTPMCRPPILPPLSRPCARPGRTGRWFSSVGRCTVLPTRLRGITGPPGQPMTPGPPGGPGGICRNFSGKSGESKARTETGAGRGAGGRSSDQCRPPHDRPHWAFRPGDPAAAAPGRASLTTGRPTLAASTLDVHLEHLCASHIFSLNYMSSSPEMRAELNFFQAKA